MKKLIYVLCFLALFLPAAGSNAKGFDFWPFKKKKSEKTEVKKPSKYEKFFEKEKKKATGYITVHLKEGKVYFEIADSLLGREFVMGTTIKSISDNMLGTVGSKNNLEYFTFTKADSTIQMRTLSFEYDSDEPNIRQALAKSNTGAISKTFKVESCSKDSSSVIDVTDIFLSDDKNLVPQSMFLPYSKTENYKSDLSYIVDTKAFSDNVSVTSSLSYTYSLTDFSGKELVKDSPLTVVMTRSILMLPKQTYHPRMADPRIGYFFTERERMSGYKKSRNTVYFTNRWRLEPSDTLAFKRGEKVEPVKPIVYYIDNDFPEWWKPYIKAAVEQWNEPFEKIGFKNAVMAKFFPKDDPEFDPDNIRYTCIRYAPIDIQNAMGPSWVDPRSGEIINASVYVYHDVIELLKNWIFVQTAQADKSVRTADIPQSVLGEGLQYVITHEVGHTLGLMHNMSASSVIPVESLRDPEFTRENGTTTSIMDYARYNYVAQPGDKERGVRLMPPRFGKYDYWAIRWGYMPVFDAEDFDKETGFFKDMLTDSLKTEPWYRYGKQQIYSVLFDPRCQNEDLGDDVIKASEYGIANLKYIMSNYLSWIDDRQDADYEFRTSLYRGLFTQYYQYFNHVLRNVGGLYKNEVVPGDGVAKFANIPRQKQLDCFNFLVKMYGDTQWIDNEKVVKKLPIVGSASFSLRNAMAQGIFSLPFMSAVSDGVVSEELSSDELLDMIFNFVWKPSISGKRLTKEDRELQQNFVNTYMAAANFKTPSSSASGIQAGEDYCKAVMHQDCLHTSTELGEFSYNPVSGFEWTPRYIFNTGKLTQASVYSVLDRARQLMKIRLSSASAEDKAHYELLISTINFSLK